MNKYFLTAMLTAAVVKIINIDKVRSRLANVIHWFWKTYQVFLEQFSKWNWYEMCDMIEAPRTASKTFFWKYNFKSWHWQCCSLCIHQGSKVVRYYYNSSITIIIACDKYINLIFTLRESYGFKRIYYFFECYKFVH